jgi:uncharacterized RDD family membrane protein YckC
LEERLEIDTPEGVVFGYQVAGIGSRFLAALVDTVIITVLLVASLFGWGAMIDLLDGSGLGVWVVALGILFVFALTWGYYIFFELVWNGQSPGKRWVGLRVIRTDGMPITLLDSLIRNLVRIIDFLPAYYATGLITMFCNAQARRLGDYAAGTLVVKDQRGVTLESVRQQVLETGAPALDAPAASLSESDYRLISDFMSRRQELRNRDELAQQIATAVAVKVGLPPPRSAAEAEDFLASLARQPRR